MQDIYIDKIKLHNCRAHTDMEFDFPVDSFTVIVGKNGSGKSTIAKAVSMALYGDDGGVKGKRLSIADMVNDKTEKDLEIILNFRIVENGVTDKYVVELYQNHKKYRNKMVLSKNGVDISGETKTATYEYIEKLLVPRDVYHNIIYFSQQVKDFFTALTDSEQKQIFDAILSTSDYNEFYVNTGAVIKTSAAQAQEIESQMKTTGTAIKITKEQTLVNLITSRDSAVLTNEKTLSALLEQKTNKENELQILVDDLNGNNFKQSDLDNMKNILSTYTEKKNSNEKKLRDEITKLNEQEHNESRTEVLQLTAKEGEEIGASKNECMVNERDVSKELDTIYTLLAGLDAKYPTHRLQSEFTDFSAEKRKEIMIVNGEISKLDEKFSTEDIRNEKGDRLHIISVNGQTLKEKAAKIREDAATVKSNIASKENAIKEDEDCVNQKVPVCSKCLRPFGTLENTGAITFSIEKSRKEIAELNSQLADFKTQMEALKVEHEKIEASKAEVEKDYSARIYAVNVKKNQECEILTRKRDLIESEISDFRKEIDAKVKVIVDQKAAETTTINSTKAVIESRIKKIRSETEVKIQDIKDKFAIESDKIKTEHNKKFTLLRAEASEKIEGELKELTDFISSTELNIANLEYQKKKFDIIKHDIEVIKIELESIDNRIATCREFKYDDNQIKKVSSEVENNEKILMELIDDKNFINRELTILEFWKEAFSDTGIKSMLIDMAIPHMNESVSKSLEKNAPGVFTVSFDTLNTNKSGDVRDKFNVKIRNNLKGTNSYKKLSGGEQRMVDLSCMDALDSLSERLYQKRFHNKFYDEVLDSLDDDSCQAIGQAFRASIADKNITLITHKVTENVEPDRVFNF